MKTLRKQSLKSVLWIIILLWGLAILLGGMAMPSLSKAGTEPTPWEEVDFSGDIEGLYISGTVYGIYDWYCEEYEDDKTVAREYFTDADDYYYMGLRAEHSDMKAADALMVATSAYFEGEDDGTLLMEAQYEVKGIIKKIPSDSLKFYHEYLDWDTMDEESKDMFLPYYIDVNNLGDYDTTDGIIFLTVAIILFLIGLLILILVLAGRYQKTVNNYIKNSMNPEYTRDKIENFLQVVPEVNGLRYNQEFICGSNNGTTIFGETQKIVWAYKHTVNHRYYFITVAKSYAIVLGFLDGTMQTAAIKKEEMVDAHLQKLQQLCPKAIIGYSADLERMFRKNLNEFLRLRYYAPETTEQNPTDDTTV